ncbi:MAG: vWA domain-containing protein, partial [Pirellula sp.]
KKIETTKVKSLVSKPGGKNRSKKRRLTKFGLDVWVSIAVHGVLLVILGLWVVVTIQNTPVLSVVAATVESNDVLMETPAESISQLESTSTDSTSITTPDTSDIKIEVDPSAISIEQTDLGIAAPSQASSISQQMSKAGAPGNKMVEGAEFFGSKAEGNRFVYIVDASPSMRRDRAFDAAKDEILRSLRSMKPKQRFAILFFGGTLETLELDPGEKIDQPQSATPENIEKAIRWLAKITIQKDGKPPVDAVKSALDFQPDGIFLLFDGDTKLDNWTQIVRRLNTSDGLLSDGGTKVPIHVIHFFRDEFQRSMQRLAQENGGSYRFVPRSNLRLQP